MEAFRILLADKSVYAKDLLRRRLMSHGILNEIHLYNAHEGQQVLLRGEKFRLIILGFDPLLPQAMGYLQIRNRMRLDTEVIALYEEAQKDTFRLLVGNGINDFVHRSELYRVVEIVQRQTRQ